jgi:hypothetical protein
MSMRAALTTGTMLSCLGSWASAVTLADPTFQGTVVEDVTQPYVFDGMTGTPRDPAPGEEPRVVPNAFRGTVNMKVIHDTDGTYDFYFRITTDIGDTGHRAPIEDFFYSARQVPTAFTVAHHSYSLADNYTSGDIRPEVGETFPPANDVWFHWSTEAGLFGSGILDEAVILLDTDARAYAKTGQFRIDASTRDFSMGSVSYAAFAPAVPEPTTYALMLGGVALLAMLRRRRTRQAPRPAC